MVLNQDTAMALSQKSNTQIKNIIILDNKNSIYTPLLTYCFPKLK